MGKIEKTIQLFLLTGVLAGGGYYVLLVFFPDSISSWVGAGLFFLLMALVSLDLIFRFFRRYPIGETISTSDGDIHSATIELDLGRDETYKALFEISPDAIALVDLKGNFIKANTKALDLFGFHSLEELTQNQINAFNVIISGVVSIKPANADRSNSAENYFIRRKDGYNIPVDINSALLYNSNGKPYAYLGILRDITERKRTEKILIENEEKFRTLATLSPIGIFMTDENGLCTYVNPKWIELSGLDWDNALGYGWLNSVHPEDKDKVKKYWDFFVETGSEKPIEFRFLRLDGSVSWVYINAAKLPDENGATKGYIGTNVDITELKQNEFQVTKTLKEKDLLLRELYHRTKNNMQVISSLLTLQAAQAVQPAISQAFLETQYRIHSMAMVHEKLYQTKNLSHISFGEYIEDLSLWLFRSMNQNPDRIQMKLNLEEVYVSLDTAIPCGLVLNEIITNSFKYAFPEEREGKIFISLVKENGKDIKLRIGDNGIGLPDHVDIRDPITLGLKSIIALVEFQLHGKIEKLSLPGTTYDIRFQELQDHLRV